jgi:HlyD family secretion protein
VVLRAPSTLGSNVAPDREPLFVIGSSLDVLRIDADVAESDIGEVKPGQPAKFTVPAFPHDFDAKVEKAGIEARKVGLVVRYPVELRVENPGGRLLPGMTTTVRIELGRAEGALATREAALRFRPDGAADAPPRSRVFRVRDGRLEPVTVAAGISDGAFTELRPENPGGLPEGTQLALGVLAKGQSGASGGAGIRLGNK